MDEARGVGAIGPCDWESVQGVFHQGTLYEWCPHSIHKVNKDAVAVRGLWSVLGGGEA